MKIKIYVRVQDAFYFTGETSKSPVCVIRSAVLYRKHDDRRQVYEFPASAMITRKHKDRRQGQ